MPSGINEENVQILIKFPPEFQFFFINSSNVQPLFVNTTTKIVIRSQVSIVASSVLWYVSLSIRMVHNPIYCID